MLILLKNNWPLLFVFVWFFYRWSRTKKIKKMLPELISQGAQILDVRTESEFKMGAANGVLNIPLNELKKRSGEISTETPLIVCCASGIRSAIAATILKAHGIKKVYNIGSWINLPK